MDEYYKTEPGDMTVIENDDMHRDMVYEMSVGVADVIGMPNSPGDLDESMETMVLFIEATTLDGKKHTLMFQESEAYGLWLAVHEYRKIMEDRSRDASKRDHPASGSKPTIGEMSEKIQALLELLIQQDDEDS